MKTKEEKNWEEQNSTLNEAADEAVSSMAGSVEICEYCGRRECVCSDFDVCSDMGARG